MEEERILEEEKIGRKRRREEDGKRTKEEIDWERKGREEKESIV